MSSVQVVKKGIARPVITVVAPNIARGWERAIVACWKCGALIPTQYDQPEDPNSRDIRLQLVVQRPMSEPRIHRAIPTGIEELEEYRLEVVRGIHNYWINPKEGKWEYTYNERLEAYVVPGIESPFNQMDYIIGALVDAPHTRRAQAVVWQPWQDAGIQDPACLQRLWCRVFKGRLVMDIDIRSNDGFKAGLMNMYAFTDLQREITEAVSARLGRRIRVGEYVHNANSFHIYGSDFEKFQAFLETLKKRRRFADRTYRTADVQEVIEEAQLKIAFAIGWEAITGEKGRKPKTIQVSF